MDDIVAAAILAGWLLVAAVSCYGVYRCQRDRTGHFVPEGGDRTVVIIPVRGVPPHLAAMWDGIAAQSFQPSRVVLSVESAADPACGALDTLSNGPPREIVVAGPATQRSQKVHNLLAALDALRETDEVVVFADADIVPDPEWLARLVKWQEPGNDSVSGHRWMVPTDDRWSTAFACVINSSLATAPKVWPLTGAWGGSMSLHRSGITGIGLRECWDRAVLDDLTLTRAVRSHGGRVHCPRDALVLSPVSLDWREAIAFGRRQYQLIRLHLPGYWTLMAIVTLLPLAGWAVALPLAARGSLAALAVMAAASGLDQLRAHFRRRVSQKLFGQPLTPKVAFLDRWCTPAWLLVAVLVQLSAAVGRRIVWAGLIYDVDRHGRVLRIAREPGADAAEENGTPHAAG